MPITSRPAPNMRRARRRADAGGGERGEDCDGVDEAFVEHSEDDIDRDEGGDDEEKLAGEGGLEGLRGSLEAAVDGAGDAHLCFGALDFGDGVAERDIR